MNTILSVIPGIVAACIIGILLIRIFIEYIRSVQFLSKHQQLLSSQQLSLPSGQSNSRSSLSPPNSTAGVLVMSAVTAPTPSIPPANFLYSISSFHSNNSRGSLTEKFAIIMALKSPLVMLVIFLVLWIISGVNTSNTDAVNAAADAWVKCIFFHYDGVSDASWLQVCGQVPAYRVPYSSRAELLVATAGPSTLLFVMFVLSRWDFHASLLACQVRIRSCLPKKEVVRVVPEVIVPVGDSLEVELGMDSRSLPPQSTISFDTAVAASSRKKPTRSVASVLFFHSDDEDLSDLETSRDIDVVVTNPHS